VSWVLLRWHDLFTALGFSQSSGWGWTLSIIFLVITARLLLVRLFIKQVHYTRNMQKMQPKIKKLREKYKDDRAELNRQMMALQQEEGFNPVSGCLPMVLQIPVFIGLYHTLRHLSNSVALCQSYPHISDKASHLLNLYTFSRSETCDASQAKILGSPLAASFHDSGAKIHALGGDPSQTRWLLIILLLISAGATFSTQLLARANATTVAEGQAAIIQRLMLYVIPLGVLGSGLIFNFPLGVLLYWFTSNLWTLGQQAYIIKFHPPEEADKVAPAGALGKTLAPKPGQRPDRKPRAQGSGPGGGGAGRSSATTGTDGVSMSKPSSAGSPSGSRASGAGGAPRVGQRPNRPNGNRPSGKRPTKAKKRR